MRLCTILMRYVPQFVITVNDARASLIFFKMTYVPQITNPQSTPIDGVPVADLTWNKTDEIQ